MQNHRHHSKFFSGFTMIELIISIAVLSFGLILMYGGFALSVAVANNIALRFNAAFLAQEGLEIVRNIRDSNAVSGAVWNTNLTSCTSGCQADYTTGSGASGAYAMSSYANSFLLLNSDGFYNYNSGSATKFQRKITITPDSSNSDVLNVDVVVSWTFNGKNLSYDANENIYNWH